MSSRRSSTSTGHTAANNAANRSSQDDEQSFSLDILSHDNPLTSIDEDAGNDIHTSASASGSSLPDDVAQHTQVLEAPERRQGLKPRMSKTPLLQRTSPGMASGSYGATPINSTYAGDDELLDDKNGSDDKTEGPTRSSKLKHALSFPGRRRRMRNNDNDDDTIDDASIRLTKSTSRRRRSISMARSAVTLEGSEAAVGLNSGYSLGGLPVSPTDSDASKDEDSDGDDVIDVEYDEEDPPDNSRYAQVRASVSALDDLTLSINTPRMWICSMIFAILGSSTNLFFSLRYPSVSITPVIALLLVHPLGLAWDKILTRSDDPEETFIHGQKSYEKTPESSPEAVTDDGPQAAKFIMASNDPWRRRFRLWLAQGRWNEKEHSCVYIASNVSFGFAFATDVIVEQTHFYKQEVTLTYQILLILSTQIIGYAFAGLSRRFLVRPGGMIWPSTLMSAAMFNTLHKDENKTANGWTMTRWKFFFIVWLGAFGFYFLPGLLFPALSYFSVITWIWPKNVVVANLFGVASGLGLFPVTFDWAQIAYIGSPLTTPFWAAMNVVGGLVIVMWIIAPIMYYTNTFYGAYMPILSTAVFDNTGKIYDVAKILTPEFLFDKEAYKEYSRVFLPITYVLSYGLQFAAVASILTHTGFWHGPDIWKQWKNSWNDARSDKKTGYEPIPSARRTASGRPMNNIDRSEANIDSLMTEDDVHNRLMRRYRDAPMWWYLLTAVSMTAIGIFVVE